MKGIMHKLAKTLEFEVRNKLCSMCHHLVTIAPINEKPVQVCTKLNVLSPLTITRKKGTDYFGTACKSEDFSSGGAKYRDFVKVRSNCIEPNLKK